MNRGPKGFTLLEVMVALAIAATAVVALLHTHILSLNLFQAHQGRAKATLLMREKLAELQVMDYDEVQDAEGEFEESLPHYSWRREVADDTPRRGVREVTVTVLFPGGSMEVVTHVADAPRVERWSS